MKRYEAEALDRMLPLSARESLYARRMISLSGCSIYTAAFEARQASGLGRDMTLSGICRTIAYRRECGPAVRRIPIRYLDRVNCKRAARGLAPVGDVGPDSGAPTARIAHWRYL